MSAVNKLVTRVEIEGEENLPTDGANLYAITHASQLDLAIMSQIPKQDVRTLLTIDAFRNPVSGKLATDLGAIPVDRENPSQTTRNHPKEVLQEGASIGVYPEGTFTEEAAHGRVGPLKKGAAAIAILGEADGVVPVALHYEKGNSSQPKEDRAGWLAGAAVAAGTFLAASGGPVARTLGGVVSGSVIGMSLGSYGGSFKVKGENFWSPGKRLAAVAGGGLAGAVVGGVAGGLMANGAMAGTGLSLTMSGFSGLAVRGMNEWWQNRPVAKVKIGAKFSIDDRIERSKLGKEQLRQETRELTEEIHQSLGSLKSELSGVPYDFSAPKIQKGFPELSRRPHFTYPNAP